MYANRTGRKKTGSAMAAAILAGLLVFGCSGGGYGGDDDDDGGPMNPPPTPLDVRGTYDAEHAFVIMNAGPVFDEPCVGTLTIDSQSGTAFSGEITIDAVEPCQGFGGVTGEVTGTVEGDDIEFEVSGIDDPLAAVGCVITGGEESFSGTVTSTAIDARRRIQGSCTFGDSTINATLDWNIDATRVET